jgi:pilus assembly protein Flp/PilA
MKDPKHRVAPIMAALVSDEEGITAIEYGLVAALISVFIMVAIGSIGEAVVGLFELTGTALPD